MFCYQCEQTPKGGCKSSIGVCGKDENIASLQDERAGAAWMCEEQP